MENVSKIFDALDELAASALDRQNPETALIDAYFAFWRELKERVGTSSGFTGLSEYLFFRYILRYIEQHRRCTFTPHELTSDTRTFRSEQLTLTHDVDISKVDPNAPRQKTDVAVFVDDEGKLRLKAGFQIKIFLTNTDALRDDLRKLDELGDVHLFEVLFNPPTKEGCEELRQFCEAHPGKAYAISKDDLGCNISLNAALDEVLQSI